MRLVAINEAEAIIEPFWDGGSSEHPVDKTGVLTDYDIRIMPCVYGKVKQTWCSASIIVEKAKPGETAVCMYRKCDIDVSGYDIFRIFARIPECINVNVDVVIDRKWQRIICNAKGIGINGEYDGYITGTRMTELKVDFSLTEDRSTQVDLAWFGLSNSALQARMESRVSPYTPEWTGCIKKEVEESGPQIGIFFDNEGLNEIRKKVSKEPYRSLFKDIRRQAEEDMKIEPEQEIGRLIPCPDGRWCRGRDMKRHNLAGVMERLAFVGIVDNNRQMSLKAVGMALSAAHSEYWCESDMGIFPGATWHHRSFTEEKYCRACALVLDWAGMFLTPHGRQIIRDAIIMKGLPRIESDFKRMDYIYSMNQGIVFSSGRIIGLLSLIPEYTRYRVWLEEAERDLRKMVDNYVQEDGGTLEGPGYWHYTFSHVMPLCFCLARYHKQTFSEYVWSSLLKTGDYALGMLSIYKSGIIHLPVNDAHMNPYSLSLVASYCNISGRVEWKQLYSRMLGENIRDLSYFDIITALPDVLIDQSKSERFDAFMHTGQVSSVRIHKDIGPVHFHFCSGPTHSGHFHGDKGSFIIETPYDILAMDRGVTNYDLSETGLMMYSARHNLVYPEDSNGIPFSQPISAQGGKLIYAEEEIGAFLLCSDNKDAWEQGVFDVNIRKVYSPVPELYIIADEIKMLKPLIINFGMNTTNNIVDRDGVYEITGAKSKLRVTPINWEPEGVKIYEEGIDCNLNPVNVLRLCPAISNSYTLLTALEVVPYMNKDHVWNILQEQEMVYIKNKCESICLHIPFENFQDIYRS